MLGAGDFSRLRSHRNIGPLGEGRMVAEQGDEVESTYCGTTGALFMSGAHLAPPTPRGLSQGPRSTQKKNRPNRGRSFLVEAAGIEKSEVG